jgi:DNA ligase (NAD+)
MTDTINRLSTVRELIDRADHAYYTTGLALMEDSVYDSLKDELHRAAPDDIRLKRVGAPIPAESVLEKRSHRIPMGSQRKAMNQTELQDWAANHPVGTNYHANLKNDGGSASFEIVNGSLFRAITRGDGEVGEDITANARRFQGIPAKVMRNGRPFSGTIRGEVILAIPDWRKADPEQTTNPRNLATGIARRKDGSEAELLTVIAFRAYDENDVEIGVTEAAMESELKAMGFLVGESLVGSLDQVWAFVEAVEAKRPSLPYWIDGIVVKIDDVAQQKALGVVDGRPKGQVAVKFEAQGEVTVLTKVELTVGHTGAIIPTAVFEPVTIGGTTVSRALLCNWTEIAALDVAIGDRIKVEKRGDIIPKVNMVVERVSGRVPIPEPTTCPVCGSPAARKSNVGGEETALHFCLNEDCHARAVGKIDRWLTSLEILGIGSEVLTSLVEQMDVHDAADLYVLHERKNELAAVTTNGIRFGERRATKLLEEIEKTRVLTLEQVIGSLGIDALGKRRVEIIRQSVPGMMDSLATWLDGTLAKHAEAAGVPNVAARIVADLEKKRPLVEKLLRNGVLVREEAAAAKVSADAPSFCFTGKSSRPRAEMQSLVQAKGWGVKDDVSKGLTFLVLADPNSTSSKAVKARKLGTKCISEEEFFAMISA